jgi:phosphotransferase system HPr (HPr) family protein
MRSGRYESVTAISAAREVEVAGAAGLHARPATEFSAAAGGFRCAITVHKGDRTADAKSVLLLLALDIRQGDRIVIRADGPDAAPAVDTLARLAERP